MSCETPIVNGVSVDIMFTRSKEAFYMFTQDTGGSAKGYYLKILKLGVHVPVSTLSEKVYHSLEERVKKEPIR